MAIKKNQLFRHALILLVFLLLAAGPSIAAAAEWSVSLQTRELFPGGVGRVEISPGEKVASASVIWNGSLIRLMPLKKESFTAFFGIPRDEKPGEKTLELTVTGQDGQVTRDMFSFQVLPREFPVQRLTLPESKVTLDQASLERHQREQRMLEKMFAGLRPDPLWQEAFIIPVEGKVLSQFGFQRILNGKPRSPHSGVDLRAAMGQPVAASAGGVVVLAEEHFFSGKSVYIDHGMGIVTMYFHLSEFKVRPGDRVETGQTIGLAGSTGRSTGPHLHWGARVHGVKVDPLTLTAATGARDSGPEKEG
ncbi:MAG: M23 family metallopeptidase [Syntrophotaleaceae bacterium]